MGRNLGPVLRRELDNLGKDGDCRKSAMKALKSYVKELDSKTIPFFLAQVSERKETRSSAGEYSISLYEVLARVHGPKIVPFIDIIMTTIRNTLISSGSSFALHQACSKVVSAIARYGIDPTTPENKKREIIHSLCKPLSDSILVSQENLSFGSAFCLKALVDSDNWRFASSEMVNEVCQRVAGALEKPMQTNSHMGLVMALAKSNSLVVEAYARLFIQSGLRILSAGVAEDNSQKRLLAIQMVNFLMKYLDPRSLFSELEFIMEEMQKCQADKMSYVKGAAFDALQTAKTIASEQGSNFEGDTGSVSESNFYRNNDYGRRMSDAVDGIPNFTSPEPQILNSFAEYDFPVESAFSNSYASGDLDYDRRVNCQLWRKFENGGLDLSFKDGLFTEATSKSLMENTEENECSENRVSANEFAGFLQESSRSAGVRSTTPSPQRLRSHISVDDIKIFTTPRKLIYSLQESSSENSNVSKKQTRRLRSPCKSKFELSLSKGEQTSFSHHPASMYDQYGFLRNVKQKTRSEENMSFTGEDFHVKQHMTRSEENLSLTGVDFHGSSESVSSSEPEAVGNIKVSQRLDSAFQTESHKVSVRKHYPMPLRNMFCGVIILVFTAFMCFFWIGSDQDKSYYLPPT